MSKSTLHARKTFLGGKVDESPHLFRIHWTNAGQAVVPYDVEAPTGVEFQKFDWAVNTCRRTRGGGCNHDPVCVPDEPEENDRPITGQTRNVKVTSYRPLDIALNEKFTIVGDLLKGGYRESKYILDYYKKRRDIYVGLALLLIEFAQLYLIISPGGSADGNVLEDYYFAWLVGPAIGIIIGAIAVSKYDRSLLVYDIRPVYRHPGEGSNMQGIFVPCGLTPMEIDELFGEKSIMKVGILASLYAADMQFTVEVLKNKDVQLLQTQDKLSDLEKDLERGVFKDTEEEYKLKHRWLNLIRDFSAFTLASVVVIVVAWFYYGG